MTLYDLNEVNCNWLPTTIIRLRIMREETLKGEVQEFADLRTYGNYRVISFINDFVIVSKQ